MSWEWAKNWAHKFKKKHFWEVPEEKTKGLGLSNNFKKFLEKSSISKVQQKCYNVTKQIDRWKLDASNMHQYARLY